MPWDRRSSRSRSTILSTTLLCCGDVSPPSIDHADGEDPRRQSGSGCSDGAIAEPAASTIDPFPTPAARLRGRGRLVVVVVGAVLARHDTPSRIKIGPAAGAVGGCAGKAYVINQGEGTVSVITTSTGVASAPIHVGSLPSALAITPDGKHAYVANKDDGTVSVISDGHRCDVGPAPRRQRSGRGGDHP